MTTSAKKGKIVVAAKGKSFKSVLSTQTNNSQKLVSFQPKPTVSKASLQQVPKLTPNLFSLPLVASNKSVTNTITPKVTPIKKSTQQPVQVSKSNVVSIPKKALVLAPKVIPKSASKPVTKIAAVSKPAATKKGATQIAAIPKGSSEKPTPKGSVKYPPKGSVKHSPTAAAITKAAPNATTPKVSPKKVASPKGSPENPPKVAAKKVAPNATTSKRSPKKVASKKSLKHPPTAAAITKAVPNATTPKVSPKKAAPQVTLPNPYKKIFSTKPVPKLPLSKDLFKLATPTIPKVAENLSTLNTALNALSSIKALVYHTSLHSTTNSSHTVASKEASIVASAAKKTATKTVTKTTTAKSTSVHQSFTIALSVNVTSPTVITPTTNSKITTFSTTKDTKPPAKAVPSKSKKSTKKKTAAKKSLIKKIVVKKAKKNNKKKKVVSSANASIMTPSSKKSTNKVTVKKVPANATATANISQPPVSSEKTTKKISSPGTAVKTFLAKHATKKVLPKKPAPKKVKAAPPKPSPVSKTIKKQKSPPNKNGRTAALPKTQLVDVQNNQTKTLLPGIPTMTSPYPITAQDNQVQGYSIPQHATLNHFREFDRMQQQQQQQQQYRQYQQHLMMQQTLPYGLANSYLFNHFHPTQWMNPSIHPPQNPYEPYSTTVANPPTTTNMLDRSYMGANPYLSNTLMPTNCYGGNLNAAGANPYAKQFPVGFQPNSFTHEVTATIDSANNTSNSKAYTQHDSEEDDYEWCNSNNDSSGCDNSRGDRSDKKNNNAPKQYFVKKEDAVYFAGIAADTEPRDAAEAYLLSQLKDMGFMDKREILSSIRRLQKQQSNSFGSYPSSDEVMCDIIGQRENAEEALKEDAARKLSEQTRKEEAKQHREIERQKDEDMLSMATLDDWKTNNAMFPSSWVLDLIIRTRTNLPPILVQEISNPNATGVTSTTRATEDSMALCNSAESWSVFCKDPVKSALLQLLKIEKKAQKWYGLDLPKCYFTMNVFDSIRKAMSVEDVDREKCVAERIYVMIESLNRIMFDLSEQSNDVPRAFLKVYDEQTLVRANIGTELTIPEEVTPSKSLNSDGSAEIEDDDSVVCLVAYPPTTNSNEKDNYTSRGKIQDESRNRTDRMITFTLGVEVIEID